MNARASTSLRWFRAGVLGSVVMTAGAIAHVSAGGLLPGLWAMVTLTVATAVISAAFLGRRLATASVVALVVGGQTAIHACLSAMAGHRAEPMGMGADAHHHGDVPPAATGVPGAGEADHQALSHASGHCHDLLPTWLTQTPSDHTMMALTHLGAAVFVGLWLAMGEQALWGLLCVAHDGVQRLASGLIAALAGLPTPTGLALIDSDCLPDYVPTRLHRNVWARGPALRGPPVLHLSV